VLCPIKMLYAMLEERGEGRDMEQHVPIPLWNLGTCWVPSVRCKCLFIPETLLERLERFIAVPHRGAMQLITKAKNVSTMATFAPPPPPMGGPPPLSGPPMPTGFAPHSIPPPSGVGGGGGGPMMGSGHPPRTPYTSTVLLTQVRYGSSLESNVRP
jgi:hypothetical protein